ncbi:TIM-barrel domain-containing protein [Cohnella sp. REN36]|uniref:glycoside hydrolase family 31 protein n=1 Tax=Cohnella sp. REN36 TaxID=2887347 RepID=UPI001D13C108|nr:TIM-barrel domain-containing protein [Cohnella sp. REN36]MCC3376149.1 glycoside hydrolase family 31 protein [Cohnella sp. REN36]
MLTSEAIHPDQQGSDAALSSIYRIGRVVRAERQGDGAMLFRGEYASVLVAFVGSRTLRIKLKIGEGEPDPRTTPAILRETFDGAGAELREDEGTYELRTGALRAVVAKDEFALKVYDAEGELVLEEKGITWNEKRAASIALAMTDESHFYGLGEKTGFLDKKGERYDMWNSDVYAPHVPDIDALYQSIPWSIHFRYGRPAYGVLLDNPGRTSFDMRTHGDRYLIAAEKGELDLYVLGGPTLKDVVSRLTDLTGKTPLPPKWAIGYQQSRYSYMSQDEVLEVARTFRRKGIPCDVLYLDIHYMDEYRVFTWDPNRFPRPKEMMAELTELGFHLVPIVDPGVKRDPTFPIYQEGVANGYFCRKLEGEIFIGPVWPGPSAFPDFTDDQAARWWGDKHVHYIDHGIKGIWNDMNEPSVFNDAKTMDPDVVHGNNGDPKTHEAWHNLYGMLMSKATQEGLKRGLGGERPFVLTRAGYTGIQRYATVWTGDNRSYWEHMAMSIPMVLNLGLSGIAFAGPDIGGFSHHTSGELLARWTQMGAFIPFCRNHSAIDTIRQEPWLFGERVEDVCRTYIGLRYRLMPLLYSLFHEASASGLPIVRPLLLEYPDDPEVYNLCDQFLFGPDLLIAPILRPGTKARAVYLPAGVWYDYWTGERHEGGRQMLAEAPLETLPIYVRAGAIVPEQPLRQHAGDAGEADTAEAPLMLRVYAGESGSLRLYEDDGKTYAYELGAYRLRSFVWDEEARTLRSEGMHDGLASAPERLQAEIRHLRTKPADIAAAGDATVLSWSYDEERQSLAVSLETAGDWSIAIR